MKIQILAASLVVAAAIAAPSAFAQMNHDHSMSSMPMQSASAAKSSLAEGEVRSIDRAKGTVTLKHGPLTALNMPPMTMTFLAKQPTLLANVKVGDKVRFAPEQGKDGTLILSSLELVKN